MSLPGNYKKKLNLTKNRTNTPYPYRMQSAAAEDMKDMITYHDGNLPKGVLHEDLDLGFKNFITNDVGLILDGEKVPVIMMGIQRWNEFSKTWEITDKYKNIKIPFITIVRQPAAQYGTNPSMIYNIPQGKTYQYAKVPTWDGNRKGFDIYKIPQPIPVDIEFEVRIFSYRQRELNSFNRAMLEMFKSRQAYTVVNGHYIPLVLEDIADESQIEDIEGKRFYIQNYTIQLQGIILDPDSFEVVPAISRVFTVMETTQK